ncbi:nascent polypeptide-associated complex subunit alpha, muscle-specific form-like [Phlebotomus argentipes]|uniref:nascent polypeptide-associated complex subunit alpha, muscle-specific form-like n=1 Tax=Phlebotomus argentipes TaxID=94469 RepID=UPI002893657F|nr:nascent polypeptide-associated complex subunit alpha, muscle-specific form-like [Phlebotomus argentipes]
MCEQTNAYDDGDIVWVKLSNCWWPGEVCEEARLPADLVDSLKKKPFAVVKFFQEDSYEYVKNINNIFKYQCSRKGEFVRKGLDLHKSNRKYMEKFPADVTTAEKLTGGDLEIVKKMQTSPQKSSTSAWSDVFSDGKAKKGKKTPVLSPNIRGRKVTKSPKKSITPVAKTFLGKTREHEVRFLGASTSATKASPEASSSGLYKCHACPFSCNRINVIVLHSKTHTNETAVAQAKSSSKPKPIPKALSTPELVSDDEASKGVQKKPNTRTPVVKPPKKRGKRKLSETVEESPTKPERQETKQAEVKQPMKKRKTDLEWKNELLADWSEDEEPEESSESNLSQAKEVEDSKEEKIENPPDAIQVNTVPVVEQKKEEVKTPIKYRNIPKKDRRDIVLESGELMEVNRPSISVPAIIPDPVPQKPKEDVKTPAPEVEVVADTSKRRSSRRKAKVSITSDEEGKLAAENQVASSKENDKEPLVSDTENNSLQSPPKSISCFDFQEEEDDMIVDSISKHRQKKLNAGELSGSGKKTREPSREVDEAQDEKLNSDIESLLKATIIPQIPDTPATPKTKEGGELSREIALPPKERGKRIFKSKNRSKSNSLEVEEEKRSSTDERQVKGGVSPTKEPTESDLQIAQTLINLPDHTPPLNPQNDTVDGGNSRKKDFVFSDCKETNAAEVLMNLGNFTETRSKDKQKSQDEEKLSTSKNANQFTAQTIGGKKIKLPDNITVTKVVKPSQSSPNHTKNLIEYETLPTTEDKSSELKLKLKKVIPKKRKPNIDGTEEIIVERVQVKEPKVVTVPLPPTSPKKIIKIKSQMKSPATELESNVFDISNMPIVLTDEPLPAEGIESYSIIMAESKASKSTSATSNGREQIKIHSKMPKTEEIVIGKPTIVKRVKLLGSQKERGSSPESGNQALQKLTTERRLVKLPPKKVKDSGLDGITAEAKLSPTSISAGNSVVLNVGQNKVSGQPLSPTKIFYPRDNRSTLVSSPSDISTSIVISKSQVIQAKSGGQIVITSKGKVITKQSDLITTSTSLSGATEVSSSKANEGAKVATASVPKLAIKSPAKIHVQSQQILYRPPKDVDKAIAQTVYIQQPGEVPVESSKGVESQKKVLRRIKRPRRLEILDSASHSSTNTQKSPQQTIVMHEVPPLAPISSESLASNCVKKIVSTTTAKEDGESEMRLKSSTPGSSVKTANQTEKIILEGTSVKKGTASPEGTRNVSAKGKSETVTLSDSSSTANAESASNIQDSQLLAIPGESFGGPANSFFLCTLDNGTFTPIDNQPLYLDASNQLVPQPPETAATSGESDAEQQGHDAIIEMPESEQVVVEGDQVAADGDAKYVLNTGSGQQILLDQQSLLAIAAGDVPRLVTPEGQELILQGSTQDILSSITLNQTELGILTDGQQIIVPEAMANSPNQDILAAALAGTEVFPQDNLIAEVPQIPAANPAQVSETNAVLTQPPIMSTLEVPTKTENIAPNVALDAGFPAQNLDDSLAVIGVTGHQTNVPTSLELPITVTNPAIAPKTTTSSIGLTSIYLPPVSNSASQISPSIPIVEEIFSGTSNVLELYSTADDEAVPAKSEMAAEVEVETAEKDALDDIIEETTVGSENAGEVDSINGNDIVPVTPESITNHDTNTPEMHFNDEDGNSSHSSEIPIQPDLILRPEDFTPSQEDASETAVDSNASGSDVPNLTENLTANTATDEEPVSESAALEESASADAS